MKYLWSVICTIGIILVSQSLLAQNYSWQKDSYYDRFNKAGQSLASDFAENLSEFEKHCGDTTKEEYCAISNTSVESVSEISESLNMMSEWEWVKSRTTEQLPVIQNKIIHYKRIQQMSENKNWLGDQESELLFTQYYEDFKNLSDIQLSYYELEQKANDTCRTSYGTRTNVSRGQPKRCQQLLEALGQLENSMAMIIESSPLLATGPMQNLLSEENIEKPISIENFINGPLNKAAKDAHKFATNKFKTYYEVGSGQFDNDNEKIKEILHDPVLLIELDPQSEWFGDKSTKFDRPTLCRLSQRIYKEKAAEVLWGFTKDVGTMATPWAAVTGTKALLGANKAINLTKNGLRTTFFTAAFASSGIEVSRLQEELEKCDQLIENFQVSDKVDYKQVAECRDKKSQFAFTTALVVTGQFFPLADRTDALFEPTQRLSRKKLKDMYQRSRFSAYQLKLWIDKKNFQISPERKRYVQTHSDFKEVGVKQNRQFIDRVNNDNFDGKMVFAAEHSFLKYHNDVAPNDKAFATALNNDFKKTLHDNLKKELGDEAFGVADKYSDYKNIMLVVDDTKENRQAVQRAYMKTKQHIRDRFNNDLKLAEHLIKSSSKQTPTSDIDKIFNAGIATGSRAPDKALKLARESRKRHPEHGGAFHIKSEDTKPDLELIKARTEYGKELYDSDYVRDYQSFKASFDEQANNVERQRQNVMDALLRSHPLNVTRTNRSRLLQDYEDSGLLIRTNPNSEEFVLSTEAIQILRKANAPRIRGQRSSEAWGREIYLSKIQEKYKNNFGVRIEKEQLEDFIEYHHSLDDFSPPFYSEKRIDMSAVNAKADVIAIDREMAGAVNEQNVAIQFAGKSVTNDEEALVMARKGVDDATGILKSWRKNVQNSVIENLSVPGRIRLMGEQRFNSLPQAERNKVLAGEYSELAFKDVIKSSADDFLITPAQKMTDSDLNQISRAISVSSEKNHTRLSIAEAYPDSGISKIRKRVFNRKATVGDLVQKQAEMGEDYAKRILDQVSKNTHRGHFKPKIQIRSSRTSIGTKKFEVIVRDNLTPEQQQILQQSIDDVMGRGLGSPYGGVKFLSPQSNNLQWSPKPPPPGEWITTWLWAGQLA